MSDVGGALGWERLDTTGDNSLGPCMRDHRARFADVLKVKSLQCCYRRIFRLQKDVRRALESYALTSR